jgi:hypothetical protein
MGRIGRKIAFRYCYVVRDPSSLDLEWRITCSYFWYTILVILLGLFVCGICWSYTFFTQMINLLENVYIFDLMIA